MAYIKKTYVLDQAATFVLLRKKYGSQANLSKAMGMSRNAVCRIMRPGKTVNQNTVDKLANSFGVPAEQFARKC